MKLPARFLCLMAFLLCVGCYDSDEAQAVKQSADVKQMTSTSIAPSIVIKNFPPLGGAVDEAAFKPALEAWVAYANRFIASFKTMSPQETARLLIDQPFQSSFPPDPPLEKLNEVFSPLIGRWMAAYRFDEEDDEEEIKETARLKSNGDASRLSENDQKVVALLRQVGLKLGVGWDGFDDLRLMESGGFFVNRIRPAISPAAGDYLAIKILQPHSFLYTDARVLLMPENVALWASEWEKYLSDHAPNPSDVYIQDAARRYWSMIEYLLMHDSGVGSGSFSAFEDGKLGKYWQRELQDVIRKYPDSKMVAMILSFLDAIAADGNRLSPAVKKTFTDKIAAGFQADAKPSAPTEALLAAEKKLIGKHGFSTKRGQAADGTDVAVISRKPTGLHINAGHSKDGLSTSLGGDVTVISDKEFTVLGTIEVWLAHPEADFSVVCNETFTFKATETSTYWRMQNKPSCEHEQGDLDVHF